MQPKGPGQTLQDVCFLSYLVDDVDAVVNPLPSEDRVEVVEPVLKVVFSVTKWDDDRHLNKRDGSFVYIGENT